jgi:Putative  PD-(D/E)XK family member, (DUF4420)
MSAASELEKLLVDLPLPALQGGNGLRFSAVPIGASEHRLGRGGNGEPALLFAAVPSSQKPRRPPRIELEHISVQHDVTCAITSPSGESYSSTFTVVQYAGGDPQLRNYFLRIAGALVLALGQNPTAQSVQEAVRRLVELFRVLAQPQRKSVQGLWAELFLIAESTDPEAMAGAWHSELEDRYDFNAGSQRIEVKSVEGRVRRHRFSLAQLRPPGESTLLIASLLLERASGGTSLEQLIERAHTRLRSSPALQAKVEQIVASTLGEALPRALSTAFDWELAQQSVAFFSHDQVPSIEGDLPPEVTEVSFTADLSALSPVDLSQWKTGLFAAARRSR